MRALPAARTTLPDKPAVSPRELSIQIVLSGGAPRSTSDLQAGPGSGITPWPLIERMTDETLRRIGDFPWDRLSWMAMTE